MKEQPGPRSDGEREWIRVRNYLTRKRFELGIAAAEEYPAGVRVAGTPLLADPRWLPSLPMELGAFDLRLEDLDAGTGRHPRRVNGRQPSSASVRPLRTDGTRYDSYSAAVAELAAPAVFKNLPTYRLLDADLSGDRGRMLFGRGHYFDNIDVGEACAHEYAADALAGASPRSGDPYPADVGRFLDVESPSAILRRMGSTRGVPAARSAEPIWQVREAEPSGSGASGKPLRAAMGGPCDLGARPVNMAISTLTLRMDRTAGTASFPLHRRDPAKVGHAGGLYQVIPAGVFQPSGAAPWNEYNDFDLWRSMIREFSEELLGNPENYDSDLTPIDYDAWPFAGRMRRARDEGRVRALVLGMGTDPLTFATDLLTAVVFDAPTFDEIFAGAVADNDEGHVVSTLDGAAGSPGVGFTEDNIDRLVHREPMQAAGAALLALAWTHRDMLLS